MKIKNLFLFYILIIQDIIIITESKINKFWEEKGEIKQISNEYKKMLLKPDYNVKNIGRFFVSEDIIYLAQSGSAIEFYLIAKSAEIILVEDSFSNFPEELEKPRYAIYVNEKILLDSTIDEKEKTVLLFNYESEQEIKIRIILLSEALAGCIGIKNINVISSYSNDEIIKPTENKKYKIEFIGDSITCGYGIEAKSPDEFYSTKTQNFEKSYAFLSAKELDFDYSAVCYSGSGIISLGNIKTNRYTTINYFSYNKEWDFKKYNSDIIVINLGTNDYGYILFEANIDKYIKKYAEFLKLVREKNPNSYIICLIGMMGCEELFPLIDEAINSLEDQKIYEFLMPIQKIEDGIGAQYHPNYVSHAKWGKLLAKIIKDIINGDILKQ